ncbi:unnamed protein product [Caenorhabditis angaria]|uniref:Uncharacterized protein n=1 Tax=Caenorhabditis angaria TaxID=860376 RepID=A0A9P1N5D6_9PELO|nr:unnamed protein product [Caenorhabditis angaria]
MFRIQPTYAFLEPSQKIYIKITINDTSVQLLQYYHYIAIFHVESEAKSHLEAFPKENAKFDGVLRIPISFEKHGGFDEN